MALQFPIDITNDTKYEARVKFTALEVDAVDVASLFGQLKRIPAGDETEEENNALAGTGSLQNAQNSTFYGDQNPSLVQTGRTRAERIQNSCVLYLPQAVQISDRAEYDNVDLGPIGAGVEAGMNAGQSAMDAFASNAVSNVTSIVKAITGGEATGTPAGRLAVNRAARLIPNAQARGAVKASTRTSVNPNTRALFKSIPLREFTFNFKLIPTSYTETQEIKKIIKFFRSELYPELITLGDNGPAVGYEFPNVFEIALYYRDSQNTLATKIQPSYIRNFSATYNSQSMAFFEGGDFTEVDISMSFIESQALDKQKVQQGGF